MQQKIVSWPLTIYPSWCTGGCWFTVAGYRGGEKLLSYTILEGTRNKSIKVKCKANLLWRLGMLAIVLVYFFTLLLKPLILFQCMIKRTYNNKIHIIEDLTQHSLLSIQPICLSCIFHLPQSLFLPSSF